MILSINLLKYLFLYQGPGRAEPYTFGFAFSLLE